MKRIISVTLAMIMLLAGISASAYSTEDFVNGDVNMDGAVDIRDVTVIQKYLIELEFLNPERKVLADTNSDGEINIVDATKIQKALVDIDNLNADEKEVSYEIGNMVNIYFTNNRNWENVYFYLYNSETLDQEKAWPGTKITTYETNGSQKTFYSTVDVSKYDRVVFNNGGDLQTMNVPLSKASSGFKINNSSNSKAMTVDVFSYNTFKRRTPKIINLTYSQGYQKKIWIWTPDDYNPQAKQKYKTVYIMDGQNLFYDHKDGYGGWQVINGVESMVSNGGRGVILVGIDNGNNKRDSELTPNIGKPIDKYSYYANGTGEAFSNFVVDVVMPYVQTNYNSSDKAYDNIIAGASSGGIEAFYIGMEHKDKFGGIGALSPAFVLFDSTVWNNYLSKFDVTEEDTPMLYIYNGKGDDLEKELCTSAEDMYTRLLNLGYDKSKIKLIIEDGFAHNEAPWRVIFPDMLDWIIGL